MARRKQRNQRQPQQQQRKTTTTTTTTRRRNNNRRRTNPGRQRRVGISPRSRMQITEAGNAFLKAATAQPDFRETGFTGIPDDYTGPVATVESVYSGTLALDDSTGVVQDLWIIVPPIPGIAYGYTHTAPDALPTADHFWVMVPYADSSVWFPQTSATGRIIQTQNVQRFRYAGKAAEVLAGGNPLTTAGLVAVGKLTLTVDWEDIIQSGPPKLLVNGFGGLAALTSQAQYLQPIYKGAYSVATHNQTTTTWAFNNIRDTVPNNGNNWYDLITDSGSTLRFPFTASVEHYPLASFTGMGDLETIVFRVQGEKSSTSAPTPPLMSIRVWDAVEYQAAPNSIAARLSHLSPASDPIALEAYRRAAKAMPIAYEAKDNDGIWDFVKGVANAVTAALSFIPGPVGMISGGVHGLLNL